MEQLRLLLAVVLSFIVFFGWNYFYSKNQVQPENTSIVESIDKPENIEKINNNSIVNNNISSEEKTDIIRSLPVDEKKYIIKTDNYIAEISSIGAKLESFQLKNYKERNKENSPYKEMIDNDFMSGSFFF